MLRLVQGDVGSGKTVVAAMAALSVIAAGGQAALMAPTELLAEQHAATFDAWFEPLGIETVFLAGKQTAAQKRKHLARIAGGGADDHRHPRADAGTCALSGPALVIVDEQHRFGVHQRLSSARQRRCRGNFRRIS